MSYERHLPRRYGAHLKRHAGTAPRSRQGFRQLATAIVPHGNPWHAQGEIPAARPGAGIATTPRLIEARGLVRQLVLGKLGWLPLLTVIASLGLLLVAAAYAAARSPGPAAWWLDPLYWTGLLTLFTPIAARLISTGASRTERIGLVVALGLGLYLVKVLRSPSAFELHDELSHYRTAADILTSGHLFTDNPLQPISSVFPGMEIITSALARLSGLSIYGAGVIELAVARLLLVLALYLAYERVSHSARVAGIACLAYLSNPKVLFFDAQYSYESLGLAFASLAIVALVYRAQTQPKDSSRFGLTVLALLGVGALVITHHLTSYALVLFLLFWAAVDFVLALHYARSTRDQTSPAWVAAARRIYLCASARDQANPIWIVLLGLLMVLAWGRFEAQSVVDYLLPHLRDGIHQLQAIASGQSAGRQLFRDYAGQTPPLWERFAQLGATLLVLIGLPVGMYRTWRHYRTSATALTLAAAALVYPVSLVFRFTQAGAEASDRAAGFTFIAVGFILATGVVRSGRFDRCTTRRLAFLTALASLVFVGNTIVGLGPAWSRLPGPHLVSADSRSIDRQSLAIPTWMQSFLGSNNRIAADRVIGQLTGAYGDQYPVAHVDTGIDIGPVFFAPGFGHVQQGIIRQGNIRYLVVDLRDSKALPQVGVYIDATEPEALTRTKPIAPAALAKFTRLIGVSQLYDGGAILVYRIGVSAHEP